MEEQIANYKKFLGGKYDHSSQDAKPLASCHVMSTACKASPDYNFVC